jgi:hypothetical protein
MLKTYIVRLSQEERQNLQDLVSTFLHPHQIADLVVFNQSQV